ncbi:MAG TPA: methyltransferase domain-containing protein [Methylomirabilota bacterium]|nr:methyltransferase domain-containing protein [Methylomirabilota bacterium]
MFPAVIDFYDRHPINEGQILEAVRRRGKDPAALLPEDLYDFDQDHYGGLAAVEALARRAAIGPASRVLDVCAGLGGPARFLARQAGARVVGVDLNEGRCAAARRLTRLVGLSGQVCFARGDAQALPFGNGVFTAVVSQEGLLHVPDKALVLAECARVLAPGGRIAFTDWVAHPRLSDGERRRLQEWMVAVTIQTIGGYRELLAKAGFSGIEAEDLSAEWVGILKERLRMYRSLREETVARFGQRRYDEYNQLYEFFVGLVEAGRLGGARVSAGIAPGTVSALSDPRG